MATRPCQIAEAGERLYERLAVYSRVGPLHVRQGTLPTAIPLLERAVALSQEVDIPAYVPPRCPSAGTGLCPGRP